MENQEKQHKRRVRYSGTHPKSYKEKYKEHNPENVAILDIIVIPTTIRQIVNISN